MRTLHIDIETYGKVSIADCGVYKYAMDPSFEILLVAYAYDDEETHIFDLTQKKGWDIPTKQAWLDFINDLDDAEVVKVAHNAAFERVCFTSYIRRHYSYPEDAWLDPRQWRCTMIQAARCGLPLSLKQVGEVLQFDKQKMGEGKSLIQKFCVPRKVDVSDSLFEPLPERVQPEEYPEDWETFKAYCVRDVDVERQIDAELSWYEVSDFEQDLYAIDQRINDYGALVDVELAQQAVRMDNLLKARLSTEAAAITGLSNPSSPTQLRKWLGEQLGIEVGSLTKADLSDLRRLAKDKPLVQKVLDIRAEMGKTSNTKYGTMLDVAGSDGRVRGMTQFYGTRTGRWAGRFVQMQNLPQNHIDALDQARQMLRAGDYDSMEMCFGNVANTMSQLIRTAFIAPEGMMLAVCDFSAIEARVLAWMAGENWVLDVFREGGDIYCATASQMFHVPVAKHGPNAELRQKGKVAVLALGYQGGKGALDQMGGARLGMTEAEEIETVRMWRNANPNIVRFWRMVEDAAKECIVYRTTRCVETQYMKLAFTMQANGTMTITLPSGRMICYPNAEVPKIYRPTGRVNTPVIDGEQEAFNVYRKEPGNCIRFKGMNQTTKKWEWIETYGGKITENITQAIARDCLAFTMSEIIPRFPITFHVHDELVMEVPEYDNEKSLELIQKTFGVVPRWAKGLPLKGAGYITPYYLKD